MLLTVQDYDPEPRYRDLTLWACFQPDEQGVEPPTLEIRLEPPVSSWQSTWQIRDELPAPGLLPLLWIEDGNEPGPIPEVRFAHRPEFTPRARD